MVPETLESRRLYSVVTASQSAGGLLTVTGAQNASNTISVQEVDLGDGHSGVFVFYDADGDGDASDLITAPDGNPYFSNVKAVRVIGGAKNDNLAFSGIDIGSSLEGNAGNDVLSVLDDQDMDGIGTSILHGGAGDDSLGIVHGNGTIAFGDAGNDAFQAELAGGGGSAVLFGNAGDDVFLVSGNVIAFGGAGNDTRIGTAGDTQAIVFL